MMRVQCRPSGQGSLRQLRSAFLNVYSLGNWKEHAHD